MKIGKHQGHLTYCSNIHAGESWSAAFANLKEYTTQVRTGLTDGAFGIGLRLSNEASLEILEGNKLQQFKNWLAAENMYVFAINGFPYGGFHNQVVKDNVHTPDWTTRSRLDYTKRLFDILAQLLPAKMDGGVSTSPLSYRLWHKDEAVLSTARQRAVEHLIELIQYLSILKTETGKSLHLDIEPEPDGMLETSTEFVDFFNNELLPKGVAAGLSDETIRDHLQLCCDVCHFAVGYESPGEALARIEAANIKIGRIQISAALASGEIESETDSKLVKEQMKRFDEPVYLHQAVINTREGGLERYPDLGAALDALDAARHREIRSHYHVPVFTEKYERLFSTQQDIVETLRLWAEKNFSSHLEVETYTWHVLPKAMQTDIVSSIVRELDWVRSIIAEQ